jgi:hypothetical protein
MKYLIEAFYKSIIEGEPLPIPYREILLTARMMDSIFVRLGQGIHAPDCGHDASYEASLNSPTSAPSVFSHPLL